MDKYEFNIKLQTINALVTKGDFLKAMRIADTIDWHRVRNVNILAKISRIYEKNGEYQRAKEILIQAYEQEPVNRRLLFKLVELALQEGNVQKAEEYYREFCHSFPEDSEQNLLRYLILKGRNAPIDKLISELERYVSTEKVDERWLYELAELYSQLGEREKCIHLCDECIRLFGEGAYAEKAKRLREQYAKVSNYQMESNRDNYRRFVGAVSNLIKVRMTENKTEKSEDIYPIGGNMNKKTYSEKEKQMKDIFKRYADMLETGSNADSISPHTSEIIAIRGFMHHMLNTYDQLQTELSEDYNSNLGRIAAKFDQDNSYAGKKYDRLVSQSKEKAEKEIADKEQENQDKISKINQQHLDRNAAAEKNLTVGLQKIAEDKNEVVSKYRNVSVPEATQFHKKQNRKAYEEKYKEFTQIYRATIAELDGKESALRKEYTDFVAFYNGEKEKAISECKNELESFKTNRENQLWTELENFRQKRLAEIAGYKSVRERGEKEEKDSYTRLQNSSRDLLLELCRDYLTDDRLVKRIEDKKKHKFDFAAFTAVKSLPRFIDQGYLVYDVFNEKYFDTGSQSADEVRERLKSMLDGINCIKTEDKLILPNVMEADTGLKYYLAANTRDHILDVRALVFSILMQYPAGRMNLVMIDPMTSTCFGGLVKLGEDDKSIIDTKVWNTDSDIQSAISRLKDKLNETVNKYGSDVKQCLEKENRILVAITDFPQGFSQRALEDLAIILENGPRYGVNFVISQNDGILKLREQSIDYKYHIDNIRARMHVYTFEGDNLKYKIKLDKEDVAWQQMYDKSQILNSDKSIINEIYYHLGDKPVEIITPVDVYGHLLADDELLGESSKEGISIPIGLKGLGDQARLVLGRTNVADKRHHVLIEGTIGSGKSVLLHAIISSALMNYAPHELEIVLLDFKDGVEFKTYADYDLPGVRIVSTESERDFGRNVFKLMVDVLNARATLFKNELPDVSIPSIYDYRDKTKKALPKILFIIDEFETLLGEQRDEISNSILEDLSRLVKQGKSLGIHVILASQNVVIPDDISSQMTVRFALDGARHVLAADNDGISLLKPNHAILNDDAGSKDRNTVFQVMYAADTLRDFLGRISMKEKGMDYNYPTKVPKKILYGNIEDYRLHPYNQMVYDGIRPEALTGKKDDYAIFVGESYDFYDNLLISLAKPVDGNILVMTGDDIISARIRISITLGLLYAGSVDSKRMQEPGITVFDFGTNRSQIYAEGNPQKVIASLMYKQMKYVEKDSSALEDIPFSSIYSGIDELYNEYKFRKAGNMAYSPRFLMIYGLEGTRVLNNGNLYFEDDVDAEDISATKKLAAIMKDGPSVGIHTIAFAKDFVGCRDIYGAGFERLYRHRIATRLDDELMKLLVSENKETKTNRNTAIYYDSRIDNKKQFRVLEIPKMEWIQQFCSKLLAFYGEQN